MKQQVSFFETESAKMVLGTLFYCLENFGQAVLGCMWIGFLVLFIMFTYQYNFVYYQKGVIEDNVQFLS